LFDFVREQASMLAAVPFCFCAWRNNVRCLAQVLVDMKVIAEIDSHFPLANSS
jgi:hypothetical protein